jgi:hypothetical protein
MEPEIRVSDKQTATDLEDWRAFLTRFGVGFKEEPGRGPEMHLTLTSGATRVTGYNGFFTSIEFDAEGAFIQLGAWE